MASSKLSLSCLSQAAKTVNPEEDTRTKILPKSQLKSNIPKPVLYVRRTREARSKSCSSSCFKGNVSPLCTTQSVNERSLSHDSPSSEHQQLTNEEKETNKSIQTFPSHSLSTSNCSRSQYSNVKAKIDNKPPVSFLLKAQGLHLRACQKKSNSLVDERSKLCSLTEDPPDDQVLEKPCLTACNGPKNMQVPVGDICLLKKKNINQVERTKSYFLKECAPEFLSSFEKEMEEVFELWLQFLCDLIVTKMTIGKGSVSHLSLNKPKISWRDEITKFFHSLPTQGELLQKKLCEIEEVQKNILQVVIQNIAALLKDHEELKEKCCIFDDANDHAESRLNEELAILGQENRELDRKYTLAIEQHELEKSKTEELNKRQVELMKALLHLKKNVMYVESKCKELESRGEKVENSRQKLEESFKNLETTYEKDNKKYVDLLKKYADSEIIIQNLRQDIMERESSKRTLECKTKELEDEITDIKSALQSSLQKRTELEGDVCDRDEKIKQLETELKLSKYKRHQNKLPTVDGNNHLELIKDVANEVENKNVQIQELKKKINRLEHMLRDKTNREEKLLSYITKLNKKCSSNCSSLNNQIKELKDNMKSVQNEVSELEKVLGQKTLELDQQNRVVKKLRELIRSKNESDSALYRARKHHEKKYTEQLLDNECGKESASYHKKVVEMYRLLEQNQMEIMKLERRMWGLQKFHFEEKGAGEEQNKTETD